MSRDVLRRHRIFLDCLYCRLGCATDSSMCVKCVVTACFDDVSIQAVGVEERDDRFRKSVGWI